MNSPDSLHEYQKRISDFIQTKNRCALFVGMGLGKTISTLTAISELKANNKIKKVLVIAPLNVCKSVWSQESKNWKHTQQLKVLDCTGNEKTRIKNLSTCQDIYLINRENTQWIVNQYKKSKWPFDMIVIDESTSFKSHSSARFKALKSILKYTTRMVLLTGTPSPNGIMDLWAQMYLLDGGERLGKYITWFRDRYFTSDYYGYSWTPREWSQEEVQKKIADITLSLSTKDYLDLKEAIHLYHKVSMPTATKKLYKEFKDENYLKICEGSELTAASASVLANKLLQFSNGAVFNKEGSKDFVELHSSKLDALDEIVKDNTGENILVAYNYKHDLERLKKRFPLARVLSRDTNVNQVISDWNNKKIEMLIAHPASAGHGINLQKGGALLIWFGLNWNLELYQQFNGRLDRQGQDNVVRIIHLVTEGTLDEKVINVLAGKEATQTKLINALKEEYSK